MGGWADGQMGRGAVVAWSRRWLLFMLLAVVAPLTPSRGSAQEPAAGPNAMSAAKWREDLATMTGLVTRLHANAFHDASREAFDAERRRLHRAIPTLKESDIIVGMARIIALVGDGHTRLNLGVGAPGVPTSPDAGFGRLPLTFEWFADGLFVRSASTEWATLVGGRVLEIGNIPVDQAIERLRPVAHHDNEMTTRLVLPGLIRVPAILRATGVVDRPGPVRIVLETPDRGRMEVSLDVSEADPRAVDALTVAGTPLPRWLDTRGRPYWLESIPGTRALYVQLNASRPFKDEPMAAFLERLRELLASGDVERVVLDLRRNDGGDSELTRPLVTVLGGWEQASRDHGLFVMIGRATFSAAVVLAAELERYTNGVFVGEPTGGRPNQYGEIETVALPNSGLTVSWASWYFQTSDPWDTRPWVTPDLFVEPVFGVVAAGRDPILERALSYDFRQPDLGETLIRIARERGVAAALEAYHDFRRAPEHQYSYTEDELTALIIDLWRRNEVAASLPVALLAAEEYPGSFEAHENLSEIYADQGNRDDAVRHAIESLRLHPANGDALSVLRDVCGDGILPVFMTVNPTTAAGRMALQQGCSPGAGSQRP